MCDRWEDADDDIEPIGKQGRVARLGIAGFVASAVLGEQGHEQMVIVDSKRVGMPHISLCCVRHAYNKNCLASHCTTRSQLGSQQQRVHQA